MTKMRRGQEGEDEWTRLAGAYGDLYELPIYLNDSPDFHVRDLPVIVRSMVADGVKVVFLDYLQLMECEALENRQVEVSRLAQIAKRTARQTDIPIVCMAQLNRALESRKDSRPILSDLRESGRLEAESDLIVMVHNPGLEADPENKELYDAELIIRKQRNGPKGTTRVKWAGEIQSFHDVARYSDLEGDQKLVFEAMSTDRMRPDQIAAEVGLSMPAVGVALSMLEIGGLIGRFPGGTWAVKG
jgi:replicative DNA helicase